MYDIGRNNFDGRSIARYIEWLNRTLSLPISFDIFLDPRIDKDSIAIKPSDRIVAVPLDDFELFRKEELIRAICLSGAKIKSRHDLTFRIPAYGILVMSKLEMIARVAADGRRGPLVWLDAGISRFFEPGAGSLHLDTSWLDSHDAGPLIVHGTPDLQRALRRGHDGKRYAGHAKRLVSGGDFVVDAARAAEVWHELRRLAEDDWLADELWDNEQVGIGALILEDRIQAQVIEFSSDYAVLVERLFPGLRRVPSTRRSLWARLAKWPTTPPPATPAAAAAS